ncbi:MAG: hypothetical protein R3C49_20385 [Planctomycetaceae bacterium]
MLNFLRKTAKHESRRRTRSCHASECCSAEILESRQLLTATAIAFDSSLYVMGLGVQDDGDRVLGAIIYDGQREIASVIITADISGNVSTEFIGTLSEEDELAVVGSKRTYASGISPNGEYFTGYGYIGRNVFHRGWRATVRPRCLSRGS